MKTLLYSTSFLLAGLVLFSACSENETGKSPEKIAEKIETTFEEDLQDVPSTDTMVLEEPPAPPPPPPAPMPEPPSSGPDPITDVDGDPEGIAVTFVDNSNGTWEFSTDSGTSWTAFGSVSNTHLFQNVQGRGQGNRIGDVQTGQTRVKIGAVQHKTAQL